MAAHIMTAARCGGARPAEFLPRSGKVHTLLQFEVAQFPIGLSGRAFMSPRRAQAWAAAHRQQRTRVRHPRERTYTNAYIIFGYLAPYRSNDSICTGRAGAIAGAEHHRRLPPRNGEFRPRGRGLDSADG